MTQDLTRPDLAPVYGDDHGMGRYADAGMGRQVVREWTLHVRGSRDAVPDDLRPVLEVGLRVLAPTTTLGALVHAGLVGDVTLDAREEDLAWVAQTAWEFRTTVSRPARARHARLVLEGVDTIGRVRVDGTVRLEVSDMFRRYVVDLPSGHHGEWDVRVEVDPALPVARAAEAGNPLPRADIYELPYNQVRKMACSFGWDWGPVTIAGGLWRPVVLESWSGPRLGEVQVSAGWAVGGVLRLRVTTEGLREDDEVSDLVVSLDPVPAQGKAGVAPLAVVPFRAGVASAEVPVPLARPWQPVGLGDQPLYDMTLELRDSDGALHDRVVRRLGFRDVSLWQQPDATGSSFELVVNGTRVWVRGFNWVPPHVLPETATREHLHHLLTEAVAAGANLLRVWGGGVIESEDFYDLCDELGLLVWQDFPFACAAYPEDPDTVAQVQAEVADAVARVGHRTSLVLWCGCNENLWGHEDWGWKQVLDGRPWGARYYHDVLPSALAELDGTRPYVPGSPFSPGDLHPNDPTAGLTHHWDTWNELDYTAFDTRTSRFAAEFGWQAPAGWPTLVAALGGEPSGAGDPRLRRLQKAHQGMESLARGVAEHLPDTPVDGRGWFYATQLVQARAVRASIGRFRSLHDLCSGAVWWQLDDCWPALSWSVLDVTGRRKLAWYAMREVLSARAVLPTAPDPCALTLVNDTRHVWRPRVTVTVTDDRGQILDRTESRPAVPPLGHLVVHAEGGLDHPGAAVVLLDADGLRGVRWLRTDDALGAPGSRIALTVMDRSTTEGDGVGLLLHSQDLVRDLVLLAETDPRLTDCVVDRQLHTLLPGESTVLRVTGARVEELTAADWADLLAATGAVTVVPGP